MINNLLFAVAVFPSFLCGDMNSLRKELHFKMYAELTHEPLSLSREYWISVGKMQSYNEVISIIDLYLLNSDSL